MFDGILAAASNILCGSLPLPYSGSPKVSEIVEFKPPKISIRDYYPKKHGETEEDYQARLSLQPLFSMGGPLYRPASFYRKS